MEETSISRCILETQLEKFEKRFIDFLRLKNNTIVRLTVSKTRNNFKVYQCLIKSGEITAIFPLDILKI